MKITPYTTINDLLKAKGNRRVTIHTYQHIDALKALTSKGFISGNHAFSLSKEWPEFKRHYDWIRKQMKEKLGNHTGDYPVWAWLENPGKIDVVKSYGNDMVKLTAEVPLERLLLTDFDTWSAILNNCWMTKDIPSLEKWFDDELKVSKKEIEDSWQMVFDFSYDETDKIFNEYHGVNGKGRLIQLVIDRLYLSEITSIQICETH
jgi:hypothetical protein